MPIHTAVATLHTNHGDIVVNLFGDHAPRTVQNFIGLSDGSASWTHPSTGAAGEGPLYKDVIFHRIIAGFMIQGGCPDGTGMGGPGWSVDAEFNDTKHTRGILSMARSQDPNSAGSQFFICTGETPHLDGKHVVFGQVTEGCKGASFQGR